ncbi:MAG: ABC transporter transmembrane domain-containing protein [Campylobacterales bacterium]
MKETFRRFWPYIKGYKGYYLIVAVGIILTVLATVATAQIMQPLMDKMFIEKDPKMLYYIPLMMIGIYVAKSVGRYLQAVFMNYIGQHIVTRLRSQLLDHMLHLDMAFLHANRSGELISRITNDINRVQYFVSNMLPELVREFLTALGLVVYVIYLNAELAFYSLVVMPLAIYPLILIAKRLRRLSHRSQEKNADVVTRLTEVFNNAEIIKANGTEAYEMGRFDAENSCAGSARSTARSRTLSRRANAFSMSWTEKARSKRGAKFWRSRSEGSSSGTFRSITARNGH